MKPLRARACLQGTLCNLVPGKSSQTHTFQQILNPSWPTKRWLYIDISSLKKGFQKLIQSRRAQFENLHLSGRLLSPPRRLQTTSDLQPPTFPVAFFSIPTMDCLLNCCFPTPSGPRSHQRFFISSRCEKCLVKVPESGG